MEDPHIRLEKWGANLDNNAIDLESDLRGMTRTVNRDEVPKNTHLTHQVDRIERGMSRLNSSATDQSRATNPTWWHKEEQQYRPDILFYNPQDRIIPDFKSNKVRELSKRIIKILKYNIWENNQNSKAYFLEISKRHPMIRIINKNQVVLICLT